MRHAGRSARRALNIENLERIVTERLRRTGALQERLTEKLPDEGTVKSMFGANNLGAIHIREALPEETRLQVIADLKRGPGKKLVQKNKTSEIHEIYPEHRSGKMPGVIMLRNAYVKGVYNHIGEIIGFGPLDQRDIKIESVTYSVNGGLGLHRDWGYYNLIGIFSLQKSGRFSVVRTFQDTPSTQLVTFEVKRGDLVLMRAPIIIPNPENNSELVKGADFNPEHGVDITADGRISLSFRSKILR